MKKNIRYILIAVVILFLLGAGIFIAGNKKSTPENSLNKQVTQTGTEIKKENSIQSTLKDLMAKGSAQKCTFTDKTEDIDMSGTMYLSGNKMRGDFNSQVEGKMMASHMIFENNTAYNWADGQTAGMMFKMDPNDVKEAKDQASKNQSFDPDKVVDYRCSPWIVDNSMFVPPSNVKFSDLSQMIAPTNTGNNQGIPNMCAACDNLSGDAKQQCLTAFKCN